MSLTLTNIWKSSSLCQKIFYCFVIFFILYFLSKSQDTQIESMANNTKFETKENNDIYDHFYSNIYDSLVLNNHKNAYEISLIENNLSPNKYSSFLDIGCGTGHHVAALNQLKYKAVGMDLSKAMVNKAKQNYPDSTYIQGDALKGVTFYPNEFTHILCLYFTIYLFKNKKLFFQNCYTWLKPGGYLVIHLVNKEKFDPIMPAADVLSRVDPQKYSKKRLTTSSVVFDDYKYKSDFSLKNNTATLTEIFKNKKDKSVRKNNHVLFMTPQKNILSTAQAAGFIVVEQYQMTDIQYYNQFIYILQKPN